MSQVPHVAGWTLVDATSTPPDHGVAAALDAEHSGVARGSQGLTAGAERARSRDVPGALPRLADAGNSKLVIAVPSGSPNESAAMRAVARDTAADTRPTVSRRPTSPSQPYQRRRDADAPIRLAYLRYVAEGPECGRWTTNLADDHAQPALIRTSAARSSATLPPRSPIPPTCSGPAPWSRPMPERRAVVFDKYRQGKPTGAEKSRGRAHPGRRPPTSRGVEHEQAGLLRRPGRCSGRPRAGARPPRSRRCRRTSKARPIPRISIQAFCENASTAGVLQAATGDRRLAKSHVSVHMGGASAAVAHYHESPTPNLIIIETTLPRTQMLSELDRLAECCDAGTKVVVIGHTNDVVLYRELLKRGVSEYLIAPVTPLQLIESPVEPLQQSRHRSGRQRHRLHRR